MKVFARFALFALLGLGFSQAFAVELVQSVTLTSSSVAGGAKLTGTVTLAAPAPAGGVLIHLQASDPAITLSTNPRVLAGQTTRTFSVTTVPVSVDGTQNIFAYSDSTVVTTQSSTKAVLSVLAPRISSVVIPASVRGGFGVTATVKLATPAPANYSLTGVAGRYAVWTPVTFAAGTMNATSNLTTTVPTSDFNDTVTFSNASTSATANYTIKAPTILSASANAVVAGGRSFLAVIKMDGAAPASGYVVSISNTDNPTAFSSTTATVPAGQSQATFPISTNIPTAAVTTHYRASIGTATMDSANFKIVVPVIGSLTVNKPSIASGTHATATVTLLKAAPSGGISCTVASSDSSTIVPPTVTILAGAKTATFPVQTTVVGIDRSVDIILTYNQVSSTATVLVTATSVGSLTFDEAISPGGVNRTGTITLTAAAPAGGTTVSLTATSGVLLEVNSVSIPAGSRTGTFPFQMTAVKESHTETVTAQVGAVSFLAKITLRPPVVISVTSGTVRAGNVVTLTAKLDGPSPSNDFTLHITQSPVGSLGNPEFRQVDKGLTTANFDMSAPSTVTTATTVDVTVGLLTPGYSDATSTVTIQPAPVVSMTISFDASIIPGGVNHTGTVTLAAPAPAGGLTIDLTTPLRYPISMYYGVPGLSVNPVRLTIPAGSRSATFTFSGNPTDENYAGTINARAGASTATGSVTIRPPQVVSVPSLTIENSPGIYSFTGRLDGPWPNLTNLRLVASSSDPRFTAYVIPNGGRDVSPMTYTLYFVSSGRPNTDVVGTYGVRVDYPGSPTVTGTFKFVALRL